MRNLKLEGGDLVISGGKLQLADGLEAVAQAIDNRLCTFAGEWFADQLIGVPYFRDVLVKNPNANAVRELLREQIQEVPGVVDVEELAFTFDPSLRKLNVEWRVTSDLGTVSGSVEV